MVAVGAVVLIDFESVQSIDFSVLSGSRLVVFAGEAQKKVPIEVAMGLQALGERAQWVRSSGVGPNALDFHIAFEIGRMVEKGEQGPIYVLSHDKGFDPLLTWLGKKHEICARRVSSLAEALGSTEAAAGHASGSVRINAKTASGTPKPVSAAKVAAVKPSTKPAASPLPGSNDKEKNAKPSAEVTRQILARSKVATRPRRRATLAKHIRNMFKLHAVAEREVEAIIAKLIANRSISDAKGAITYHF